MTEITTDTHVQPVQDAAPQMDYFGFATTEKFYFPDGVSYVEFNIMNEGKKAQFQKMTSRDLVIERQSGNARTRMDPATERHELLKQSIIGWNLQRSRTRGGPLEPVPFSPHELGKFLQDANPKIIEDIEVAIRKANPWLMPEQSVADIDKQIEELRELREAAVERERGESDSASK